MAEGTDVTAPPDVLEPSALTTPDEDLTLTHDRRRDEDPRLSEFVLSVKKTTDFTP